MKVLGVTNYCNRQQWASPSCPGPPPYTAPYLPSLPVPISLHDTSIELYGSCLSHASSSGSSVQNHCDGITSGSWASMPGSFTSQSFASREPSHGLSMSSLFDHELGQVVDNSPALLNKMAALCDNDELSDIELVVSAAGEEPSNKWTFRAHKLILCSSSDVLKVMLLNPMWRDSLQPRVEFEEEPECAQVFPDLLRYMYTGRVLLTHDTVLPVLMLADKYNVIDLQDVCCRYMSAHLVSTTRRNRSVSWFQYAANTGHECLSTTCRQFILWNFYKVACTSDFLMMELDVLVGLIRQSELVVPDELTLFRCVSRWVRNQQERWSAEIRKDLVIEVLSHIRFAMIPPSQIGLVTADPIFADYADFFEERIGDCLNFHSAPSSFQRREYSLFEPRNYTNEVWSTTLSVDEFTSFSAYDVRPVFFSTPASAAASNESAGDAAAWEWTAELFPKGVHFLKFVMIGLWRNVDVGGTVYETVRLVIAAKSPETRRTNVAVLVTGVQDGVEYIRRVVERRWYFDGDSPICQLNDIVPFGELNCPSSPYMSGTDGKTFKIMIVIKPISDISR